MTTAASLSTLACGPSELSRCRELARARAAGEVGAETGSVVCRRALPMLEVGLMPVVAAVDTLAGILESLDAGTWQLLELALPAGPRRVAVRRRAEECAAMSGRGPVLTYSRVTVLSRLPVSPVFTDPEAAPAQLVEDAVLAAVTGDLLTHAELHALRRPLFALLG